MKTKILSTTTKAMLSLCIAASLFASNATVAVSGTEKEEGSLKAKTRHFRFDYSATISGLSEGEKARVWIPVPPSNSHQTVKALESALPAKPLFGSDDRYGNKFLYFEAAASASGEISFSTAYRVRRMELRGRDDEGKSGILSEGQKQRFLAANRNVPISGKPVELLDGLDLPRGGLELGRALYNLVYDHVTYDKSKPGYGRGDSVWVCESRSGNCTDFHSLFISLARSLGTPAHFEIGFPLPPEHGKGSVVGYHCWALFHVNGHGWVPVDISEADKHPDMKEYYFGNLSENRVAFTTGRDLTLSPEPAHGPLNFFVYPHVEVNGKLWPKAKIELRFSYADAAERQYLRRAPAQGRGGSTRSRKAIFPLPRPNPTRISVAN